MGLSISKNPSSSSNRSSTPKPLARLELGHDENLCTEAVFKHLIFGDSPDGVRDRDETLRLLVDAIAHKVQYVPGDSPQSVAMKEPIGSFIYSYPVTITLHGLTIVASRYLNGSRAEKCDILRRFAAYSSHRQLGSPGLATTTDMVNLVSGFVQAYLNAQVGRKNEESWCDGVGPITDKKIIAVHLLEDLLINNYVVGNGVREWYDRSPLAAHIIHSGIRTTLKMIDGSYSDYWNDDELLPACDGADWSKFKSILTVADVLLLNYQLPVSLRHQWRYLFSSRQYGESFSQLIGRIVDRGPTMIVMTNYQGETFGGFASESWKIQSKFYGSSESFLFTLRPKMGVFRTTGYNENYMYLNVNQQTMPNGLGMGGQLEYFGLSVSNNYGRGTCTKSCTTFNSPQLSSELEFDIAMLEVWGVGPEPKPEEGTRRSALDTLDPELKAILEMTGRAPISDDIRKADKKDPSLRDTCHIKLKTK